MPNIQLQLIMITNSIDQFYLSTQYLQNFGKFNDSFFEVKIRNWLQYNITMSQSDSSSNQKSKEKEKSKVKKSLNNEVVNDPMKKENKNLRKKLRELSSKLDEEIQKAAQLKLKSPLKYLSTSTTQSQNLQLQNANKVIDRLQKAVRQFESKQSYQVSVKRIMDLQGIIKKKQSQLQQLKVQFKTNKRTIRQKERSINELIQSSKKVINPAQDKQIISKLKEKLRVVIVENQQLKKREMKKHEKLIIAQRKIIEFQQDEEPPMAKDQNLLNELQNYKDQIRQCMMRVQKQNKYIVKLNEKLSNDNSRKQNSQSDRNPRTISKSMEELPDLNPKKNKISGILEHIPFLHIPQKLKRY